MISGFHRSRPIEFEVDPVTETAATASLFKVDALRPVGTFVEIKFASTEGSVSATLTAERACNFGNVLIDLGNTAREVEAP